jgi:hypothetical protein
MRTGRRAEACAQDFYSALDAAISKLEARLRRSHDRRRITARRSTVLVGRGGGGQTMLLEAPPDIDADVPAPRDAADAAPDPTPHLANGSVNGTADPAVDEAPDDMELDEHRPGQIVRRKVHTAHPDERRRRAARAWSSSGTTSICSRTPRPGPPSVVYRRKGLRLRRDSAWRTDPCGASLHWTSEPSPAFEHRT